MIGGKLAGAAGPIGIGAYAVLLAQQGAAQPDFWGAIANVGFPIAVAAFLLLRLQPRMDELSKAIRDLQEAVRALDARRRDGDDTP